MEEIFVSDISINIPVNEEERVQRLRDIEYFCSYCGAVCNAEPEFIGYDSHTGDRQYVVKFTCPKVKPWYFITRHTQDEVWRERPRWRN